jgi:hypothetical protein
LAPGAPLEPCGLVRVVTGAPAGAEPVEVDACEGLGRVVTGAPVEAVPDGAEPVAACEGLVRVVTAGPPAAATVLKDPARCEPLAPVWTERAELTGPECPCGGEPPPEPDRAGPCSWRTMWIVRRITCVVTAGVGLRAASETDDLGWDRSEKPARPAASSAANAPAIRVCVLRIFRSSGGGWAAYFAAPAPCLGQRQAKVWESPA